MLLNSPRNYQWSPKVSHYYSLAIKMPCSLETLQHQGSTVARNTVDSIAVPLTVVITWFGGAGPPEQKYYCTMSEGDCRMAWGNWCKTARAIISPSTVVLGI